MNSVDMANALINRAKNLQKFTVETEMPSTFRFNGTVPFDMKIDGDQLTAEVYAVDFDEACMLLNNYLESCQ